jgi:hypothetical protein
MSPDILGLLLLVAGAMPIARLSRAVSARNATWSVTKITTTTKSKPQKAYSFF